MYEIVIYTAIGAFIGVTCANSTVSLIKKFYKRRYPMEVTANELFDAACEVIKQKRKEASDAD